MVLGQRFGVGRTGSEVISKCGSESDGTPRSGQRGVSRTSPIARCGCVGGGFGPWSSAIFQEGGVAQSSGGTPRSVQDRSPDMSMRGNRFAALAGAETVSVPDMDDAVATQPAQVPLPTCVDEEPQGECPRQRLRLQLISQSTRVLADTAASEDPPRHPTVVPLTESEGSITSTASSHGECARQSRFREPRSPG